MCYSASAPKISKVKEKKKTKKIEGRNERWVSELQEFLNGGFVSGERKPGRRVWPAPPISTAVVCCSSIEDGHIRRNERSRERRNFWEIFCRKLLILGGQLRIWKISNFKKLEFLCIQAVFYQNSQNSGFNEVCFFFFFGLITVRLLSVRAV